MQWRLALFIFLTMPISVRASEESAERPITYGDIFFEETQDREAPRIHLNVGYAQDVTNSFLDLHSIVTEAQVRVWKYFSTGLMGHWMSPAFSAAGSQFRSLRPLFYAEMATPQWGIFSLTQLNLMIGQWNILNWMPLRVDLVVGGGFGYTQIRPDYDSKSEGKFSYLWSVEQRFQFFENAGLFASIFGHRGGLFLGTGINASFR